MVKNFNYDGAAPDAFFVVGTAGIPGAFRDKDAAILAHPFEGVHYDYSDLETPVLDTAVNEEVVLNSIGKILFSQIFMFHSKM